MALFAQGVDENKRLLQVLGIQLQTLASLDSVKKFLELQEKAELLSRLINEVEDGEPKFDQS